MAWGYERSFTIEHDNTLRRRINCKDCIYYDSSDRSCLKRPLYLPVDGYNSWKNCEYFDLSNRVSHYDEKETEYSRELARRKTKIEKTEQEHKKSSVKKIPQDAKQQKKIKVEVQYGKTEVVPQVKRLKNGYDFCVVKRFPKGKKFQIEYIQIKKSGGSSKKVMIGRLPEEKKIYITSQSYTKEAIEKAYHVLNKK